MSATEHQSLFAWLNHIKYHHDNNKEPIASPPLVSRLPPITPTTEENNKSNKKVEFNPIIYTTSDDNTSIDSSSKKSSSINPFSRHFRNIHFHRPHGLFQRHHSNSSTESTLYPTSTNCSCAATENNNSNKRPSGSSNDADDEHEDDEGDSSSIRSKDGTKYPPCMCSTTENGISNNNNNSSRENSIFTLPSDVDSPEVGFKKLKEDGDLVDYDEISMVEEEEEYQDDHSLEVHAHYRSVIRNDLIRLAFNGPFQSPLPTNNKKQALHVGCGNGAWCVEMAQLFPNWLVVGIDDKTGGPIQDQRKVPKNFKYIRCYYDVLRTLKDIPSHSFDLILCRFMIFAYSEEKYKELIIEIERICKPGGYAEFNELDMRIYGNPKAGPMTHKLNAKVFGTMESNNLNPRLARKLGDLVSNAFFHTQQDSPGSPSRKKINKREFSANYTSLPMGVWGGRLGVMFRDDIHDLIEFFEIDPEETSDPEDKKVEMSSSENESNDPYLKDFETMEEEMESQKSFMNLHHVYARKRTSLQ